MREKFQPGAVKGVYLGPDTDRNTSVHEMWAQTPNQTYIANQVLLK